MFPSLPGVLAAAVVGALVIEAVMDVVGAVVVRTVIFRAVVGNTDIVAPPELNVKMCSSYANFKKNGK